MWPFKKRTSLSDSGILNGFTDWHSHLLPGVDDGVQTVEESLQILSLYEKLGINEVWLTPHVMEDMSNETGMLKERFMKLRTAYKGPVILHLAAEYMLDIQFEDRLSNDDLLLLGKEGKHLLVETSYFNPPMGLDDILLNIKSKGYVPMLAHPERYAYMERSDYLRLRHIGVHFQSNLPSLAGSYGRVVRKKAEWFLEEGITDIWGTDTHCLSGFSQLTSDKVVKSFWEKIYFKYPRSISSLAM